MRNKKLICRKWHCKEPLFSGGLCKAHREEERKKELETAEAIETLNRRSVNGKPIENPELNDELLKVIRWWDRACRAINVGREDSVLLDETEFAPTWCITIANGIIKEVMAYRSGQAIDPTISYLKRLTWERFENLEAGVMSNGVKRPLD